MSICRQCGAIGECKHSFYSSGTRTKKDREGSNKETNDE